MSILCGWCGQWVKKDAPIGLISHGICRSCADKMLAQMMADEEGVPERVAVKH